MKKSRDNSAPQHAEESGEIDLFDSENVKEEPRRSQADRLVDLIDECSVELVRCDKVAYALVPLNADVRATFQVSSLDMRHWLRSRHYRATKKSPTEKSMSEALSTIEARALYDPGLRTVNVDLRVGGDADAAYIDLGDSKWRMIRIDRDGWSVMSHAEGKRYFRRTPDMQELPMPQGGGSLNLLRRYVHLDDESLSLLASWLVMAAMPKGPYPILALIAEQGSAKSTLARMLRALLDPSRAPLTGRVRDERNLLVTAHSSWMLVLDNLSHIGGDLSDALCGIATGTAQRERTLYTNIGETTFAVMCPTIITSIDEVVTRDDLAERSVMVRLRAIEEKERRDEAELWKAFEEERPLIFGALLDAVSMALRRTDEVRRTASYRPRMADYALVAQAAEATYGVSPGTWERAHRAMRNEAYSMALEAPVAQALTQFMKQKPEWEGTAAELLLALEGEDDPRKRKRHGWPTDAARLSKALRRLKPSLREVGLRIELDARMSDRKRSRIIRVVNESRHGTDEEEGSEGSKASSRPASRISVSALSAASEEPLMSRELSDTTRTLGNDLSVRRGKKDAIRDSLASAARTDAADSDFRNAL